MRFIYKVMTEDDVPKDDAPGDDEVSIGVACHGVFLEVAALYRYFTKVRFCDRGTNSSIISPLIHVVSTPCEWQRWETRYR